MQRGEDAGHHVQRTDVVGDEGTHGRRRIPVASGGADEAAGSLAGQVGAFPVRVRPQCAERAALGADDARVDRRQVRVAKPPFVQRARLEVAHHHVRLLGQTLEDRRPFGTAQVQRHAALAAVAGGVDGAARIVGRDMDVPAVVANTRQFDLHHVRAHVREQRGSLRPLDQQPNFQNANVLQRPGHVVASQVHAAARSLMGA